jgi:hypothetical protein
MKGLIARASVTGVNVDGNVPTTTVSGKCKVTSNDPWFVQLAFRYSF